MVRVSATSRYSRYLSIIIILLMSLISIAFMSSTIVYGTHDSTLVTTNIEVGSNDFRISDMGPDGDTNFGVSSPAIAYNSRNHEYLVTWSGDDQTLNAVEIRGQRINADTGQEIGTNDFQISQVRTNIDPEFRAFTSDIVYNPNADEYLAVWAAYDLLSPDPTPGGIYGQRLDANTGAPLGTDDFRIDPPNTTSGYLTTLPAIAYNSSADEYLVVWESNFSKDDDESIDDESIIVGQRLTSAGEPVGENLAITTMMPYGLDVAYHPDTNEFLVVWAGNDDTKGLEIFAQRLDATTGVEVGDDDFRISDMESGDDNVVVSDPVVTYNDTTKEYFVAWSGGLNDADIDFEIYGQRLSASGEELGDDDFQISETGSDSENYTASEPAIVYNPIDQEYLVSWAVDTFFGTMNAEEYEIYGQRLDGVSGAEVGEDDFRISDMGPDDNNAYQPYSPAISYNSKNNTYLVAWSGDDNTEPMVNGEFEIFGQQLAGQQTPTPTATSTSTSTTTPPTEVVPTLTPTPDAPPIEETRVFLPMMVR